MKTVFVEQENGPVRVFKKPEPGMVYSMGIDGASGLAEDFSSIQIVTNAMPFEQVAVFRAKFPVNQVSAYANMMGRWYNDALNVCEINYPGNSIQDALLQYYQYPRNYQREQRLEEDPDISSKYGFRTTETSKWELINEFLLMMENDHIRVNDPVTLAEMNNFVYQETKRKAGAAPGFNDDTVMALMLALHGAQLYPIAPLREQVRKIPVKQTENPDTRRDWRDFRAQIMKARVIKKGVVI